MEKLLRQFSSSSEADRAGSFDDDSLTREERFKAFLELMGPYYRASAGFQRVYRIDDLKRRSVCDDWGIRIQPISEPPGDG